MPHSASKWAVVDVETSGLSPNHHRVLSLAVIALDRDGRVEDEFTTLFNPGCDPGPVHIHGLTLDRLAGAPTFDQITPRLTAMLAGRTLVAHNATFDHGFLASELTRANTSSSINHRLCTMTLSRRLQLEVPNHKLSTLARHWKIQQRNAHDAFDDARVTSQVFAHSAALARSLGMPLPVVNCALASRAYPDTVVRVPCPWVNPGRFDAHGVLVQGMKVAITGDTRIPRLELAARMTAAGLDVMNSVSGRTGVVVCNEPHIGTRKLERARAEGLAVLSEGQILQLLRDVRVGVRKSDAQQPVRKRAPRPTAPEPQLPWSGRRVLVVGGAHDEAAAVRLRLIELGARPSVNLSAGVTHVVILDGGEKDSRMTRIRERGLPTVPGSEVLGDVTTVDVPNPQAEIRQAAVALSRGAVIDMPDWAVTFGLNVSWSAAQAQNFEVDIVAFELGADERVGSDEDFVFYNQPASADGGVRLSVDGDCEQGVRIDLTHVDGDVHRIAIAAAIDGDGTFGDVGALAVEVATDDQAIASSVLDAGTSEQTMLIAEVYRRHGVWRLRAVGQGYDHGLAELAAGYGVDVDS
ncbi:DNA polymerase-3 subunit epsilon [Williamsia limnetica]|uniref:DNA polymerase-3 subunit epsilon n=1 Tax=Williamsia limnetica TaxID=882452 RepID=A0A318R9Z1_WILLI|nr:TerD family protein [Williamsia limnetica]PYE11779.1 DNA polymerase-3 subunit epsilon [Williamsia limnetica]